MQKLFGIHPVLEAIRAGRKIDKVLLKQGMEGPAFRELITCIGENDIPYQYVPVEKLNREVRGAHQGVIALLAEIDYVDIETLINNALATGDEPVLVILDGVSDVRNLGAIARTLECCGGKGIIVPAKGGAAVNAEAVKASAGALLRIDTCKVPNLRLAAYLLKQNGFKLVAATEKTDHSIFQTDLRGPLALVMGSEGKGISDSLLALCDERGAIPMVGEISSLNVSVATAVVLYEAFRQKLEAK